MTLPTTADVRTTTDSIRLLALQQLRRAIELAEADESDGLEGRDHAARHFLTRAYNETCNDFSTDEQLSGDDPRVSPGTDLWILAYQLAVGALYQWRSRDAETLDVLCCLESTAEDIELDLERPKATSDAAVIAERTRHTSASGDPAAARSCGWRRTRR
jgi:hypothetical protein